MTQISAFSIDITGRLTPDPAFESNKPVFEPETEVGLRIYVGLLLLTPKVLSLTFDPQDNTFLSWAHSYAASHNRHNCWVYRALPPLINWRLPMVGFSTWRKSLSSTLWWRLAVLRWTGIIYCTLTMGIMWLLILILTWFNDYFAAHKKVNGSRSGGFLPDAYQIWDQVIWLTPKKGCLLSNATICGEQIEPSPEVSQQFNYNDWKQLGFLPQEVYNTIILVFCNPSLGPPFAWPGTDWDWIPQSH